MERKSEHKQVRMLDNFDHVHRFRVSNKKGRLRRERENGRSIEEVGGKIAKITDQPE